MIQSVFLRASSASVLAVLLAQAPAAAQNAQAVTDEIVVTATKREESLVKVPISVSVVTERAIAERGINRPADFLSSTPNVSFREDNAGEAFINIRGQTSVRNSDPNVAIVIDGVTLSSVKPFNQDLFGIQQIEVLKGPQSALYGRNAAAGAIVITTKKPGKEFEGNIVASTGSFNNTHASATVSGPLTDSIGFSLAGSIRDTDGPFTNITTGEKVHRFQNTSGRARLVYDDGGALTLDLKVTAHHSKGGGSAYNAQFYVAAAPQFSINLPQNPTQLDSNFTDVPFVSNVIGAFNESFADVTLKADYDMDWAKLTSITSYNRLKQRFGSDSPPYIAADQGASTVQQYTYLDKNFSQELRITSPGDQRLRWQVGFYYLRFNRNQTSKISGDDLGNLPVSFDAVDALTVAFGNPVYRTTSYAPFASLQFDVTEKFHISLAGRYDTEKRSIREAAPTVFNTCVAFTGKVLADCTSSRTFKQFEPKASISYDVDDNASVYASYGKGFKSGGFNPIGSRQALIAALPAGTSSSTIYVQDGYNKEVSESFEIGAKAKLFDRRLSINVAAFQTKVFGAQQFQFQPAAGLQTTVSIDEVELKGFDVDFNARLPLDINIFGGFGYTDGKIKNFAGNPANNGNIAPGAYKTTLNLGASMSIALNDTLSFVPRVEMNRYGSIWWDVDNTPGTKRNPLTLLKARMSLKSGDKWEISAFGDNLTNKKYFQEIVPLLPFYGVNFRGPTRSYGVEARLNF